MRIQNLEAPEGTRRDVVYVVAATPEAIDFRALVRTPHFVAVVVADGRVRAEATLYRLALALLGAGAVYFVAAGPNAARMERTFDDAILFGEGTDTNGVQVRLSTESSVILTVSDEDVDEALWFALTAAYPAQDYDGLADTLLVVCEDGPLAGVVDAALADLPKFLARMRE